MSSIVIIIADYGLSKRRHTTNVREHRLVRNFLLITTAWTLEKRSVLRSINKELRSLPKKEIALNNKNIEYIITTHEKQTFTTFCCCPILLVLVEATSFTGPRLRMLRLGDF